jgi:hypothetical protein
MGFVEICSAPMKYNGKWVLGYHAGRLDGRGNWGYVIYGELSESVLRHKLEIKGYKTIN